MVLTLTLKKDLLKASETLCFVCVLLKSEVILHISRFKKFETIFERLNSIILFLNVLN